jgi:predicted negative regulator of RcsB-dependent stress response
VADFYASEQEQVEQLKRWWKDNGRALVAGLVIGIGGLAGYRYWDGTQIARAENASVNYEHFLQMAAEGRNEDAVTAGRSIIDSYPGTAYARLSNLILAKIAVGENDYAQAKQYLRVLIDASDSGEIAQIARARLARILLAEGAIDEAGALVAAIPSLEDHERFAELRGDISVARGDTKTAKTMYLQALSQAAELGLERGAIQLKLDNLNVGDGGNDS